LQNDDKVKYVTEKTEENIKGFSVKMYGIKEIGSKIFSVEYADDPNETKVFSYLVVMALHRANLKLTFPDYSVEEEYHLHAGQDLAVAVSMHDYLGDDPLSGANIYLEY